MNAYKPSYTGVFEPILLVLRSFALFFFCEPLVFFFFFVSGYTNKQELKQANVFKTSKQVAKAVNNP